MPLSALPFASVIKPSSWNSILGNAGALPSDGPRRKLDFPRCSALIPREIERPLVAVLNGAPANVVLGWNWVNAAHAVVAMRRGKRARSEEAKRARRGAVYRRARNGPAYDYQILSARGCAFTRVGGWKRGMLGDGAARGATPYLSLAAR